MKSQHSKQNKMCAWLVGEEGGSAINPLSFLIYKSLFCIMKLYSFRLNEATLSFFPAI